jgi:hypothetical protein
MQFVHINCYSVINNECSKRAHLKLGLDYDKTQQCWKGSFDTTNWGDENTNNTKIDTEIEYWRLYGSGIYPSIVVNNRTYRGQIESLAVFNALCAGFFNTPGICNRILGSNTPDFIDREQGIQAGTIVAVVIGLILLNIMIVYCYRRHSKREMQQEMNIQIDSAVS